VNLSPEPAEKRFCLAEKDLSGAITGAVKGLFSGLEKPGDTLLSLLIDYTASDAGIRWQAETGKMATCRGVKTPREPGPDFAEALRAVALRDLLVYGGGPGPGQSLILFPDGRSALLLSIRARSPFSGFYLLNSRREEWYTPPLIRFATSMKEITESLMIQAKGR